MRGEGCRTAPPLVAHVVYRFDTGGLENGVVNLINHMPEHAYRHVVIALTQAVPVFAARVRRRDVEYVELNQPPGHAWRKYPRIAALFRQLAPAIVHTRNLAALELQVPAAWAGVPARVHGEHGRDVGDLDGSSRKYQWVRRAYSPFVHRYVALSQDLERYLRDRVGIASRRIVQVYNGVDSDRFRPADRAAPLPGCPFVPGEHWIVGTVGRMQTVKNQVLLVRAFLRALELAPQLRTRARLALVGDGPLRSQCAALLGEAGAADLAWLPGERADVPEVMRALDCFALPSLAEGISNTILEAMSSGVAVVATDVGGNAELVAHGRSGEIVPSADVPALAASLVRMASDPERTRAMGRAGREEIERRFSLKTMVAAYTGLYDALLPRTSGRIAPDRE